MLNGLFRRFWPPALLFLLTVVFFEKFFLQGLIPLPADITLGMYYPWLDYKWGFATAVPVKNAILSDVISVIYPLKAYALDLIKFGQWPLWNSHLFAGYPLWANFQIGLLNPSNVLYGIFSRLTAWSLQVISQPIVASFFTYLYLRDLKLKKICAILGGVIYAFSGFNIIWLEWNAHGWSAAFFPLLLLITGRYLNKPKISYGIFFSFFLALQIFSGYPQLVFYSLVAIFLFVVFFKGKLFYRWLIWLILGIFLAAIKLVPAYELLLSSQRQGEVLEADLAYLPWPNLISFFAPDYFGHHSTLNFWGQGNYTNNAGYSGMTAIILSTTALIYLRKKNKIVSYFLAILIISLALALPSPLTKIILGIKFLGFAASSGTRSLFLANFSLACLGAFGFQFLLKRKPKLNLIRAVYLPIAVLGSGLVGSFLAYQQFSFAHLAEWEAKMMVGMRNLILPLIVTAANAVCLWLAAVMGKRGKFLSLTVIFFLAVFELLRFSGKYLSFSRSEMVFPSTPVIEFLRNQPGNFRVDGGNVVPMNMLLPYGLESFSAYDAMYPRRIAQYIALANGGMVGSVQTRYGRLEKYESPLFDLANICLLTALKEDKSGRPDENGAPAEKFQLEKFYPVFSDKTVVVLKNQRCLPRAFLVHQYLVENRDEKIIRLLTDKDFPLQEEIILEKEPEISFTPLNDDDRADRVILEKNLNSQKILSVESQKPGFLFIADGYYPGWSAFVDKRLVPIYRADFAFQAVFVPEGKHTVSFIYNPLSVKIGVIITLVSVLISGGLLIYGIKERPRIP